MPRDAADLHYSAEMQRKSVRSKYVDLVMGAVARVSKQTDG